MSSWFRVAALVALLVVAVTANGQTLGPNENPHPSVGIYAAEVGGGFLGELAAVAGVSLAVFGIGEATGADWLDESSIPYGILWVVALVPAIPAGSAGGACFVGHHYGGDGKFWAAGNPAWASSASARRIPRAMN